MTPTAHDYANASEETRRMNAPERIKGWRDSQLSIARFYGGCKIYGHHYTICQVTDDLVRDDVMRAERKASKEKAIAERAAWMALQGDMLHPREIALEHDARRGNFRYQPEDDGA